MKKVAVISGTNHYEERMRSVIEEYKKDSEVVYLISDFDHITKSRYVFDKESAKQIHVPAYEKNLSMQRIFSHLVFSIKVFFLLCKIKPDVVYVEIPHNTLAASTKWYKRFHKCELIMDIFDMWPESLPMKKDNVLFKMACRIWRGFRNRNLKFADKVYTECNYYQELMNEEGCFVPMETKYLTRKRVDVTVDTIWEEDRFHVCYVGNINNIIDIPFIAGFLADLNRQKKVCVHLVGNGEGRTKLIESLEYNGIQVVSYGVVYDVYKLQEIMNKCYLGLNFLLPDLAIGLTMKSITYLRAGMPLLNTVPGDTWEMVEKHDVGINITREERDIVIQKLLDLKKSDIVEMKNRARRAFEEHFSED